MTPLGPEEILERLREHARAYPALGRLPQHLVFAVMIDAYLEGLTTADRVDHDQVAERLLEVRHDALRQEDEP